MNGVGCICASLLRALSEDQHSRAPFTTLNQTMDNSIRRHPQQGRICNELVRNLLKLTGLSHSRVFSKSRRQTICLFTMRFGILSTSAWNGLNFWSLSKGASIYRSICLQAPRFNCLRSGGASSKVGDLMADSSSCESSVTADEALEVAYRIHLRPV